MSVIGNGEVLDLKELSVEEMNLQGTSSQDSIRTETQDGVLPEHDVHRHPLNLHILQEG